MRKYSILLLSLLLVVCSIGFFAMEVNANTITLAHSVPETHAYHEGYLMFQELVEERTDGEITVNIFPDATLGGDQAAADSVRMGNIEMALTGTFVLYDHNPHWGVFDLPFLFRDYEEVDSIIEGEIGEQLLEEDLGSVIAMDFMENGFRYLTNSVRPVEEPADLEGMRVRIMEGPIYVDSWEAMGASANPMSFDELYSALDTGVVDGMENPPSLIYTSGFYEVQEYMTETLHQYLAGITIMNEDWFNSLSSENQEIITESFSEAAEYQRELVRERDEEALEELQELLEYNTLTGDERDKFAELTFSVYEEYAEEIGEEFVIEFLEELGRDDLVDYLN